MCGQANSPANPGAFDGPESYDCYLRNPSYRPVANDGNPQWQTTYAAIGNCAGANPDPRCLTGPDGQDGSDLQDSLPASIRLSSAWAKEGSDPRYELAKLSRRSGLNWGVFDPPLAGCDSTRTIEQQQDDPDCYVGGWRQGVDGDPDRLGVGADAGGGILYPQFTRAFGNNLDLFVGANYGVRVENGCTTGTTWKYLQRTVDGELLSPPECSNVFLNPAATKDFIDLLSNGTDFGLASFASSDPGGNPAGVDSSKDFPPEAGLRALNSAVDRNTAKTAVDGLSTRTGAWTRIGAGLRQARTMLLEAGGTITLNSTVLLLTDGLNNRPVTNPQADLDGALQELANNSLRVFATCIGEARDSVQCSYIADQTAGRYVDSAETESLFDAFVEFAAEAQGHEISSSEIGTLISQGQTSVPISAFIEEGVEAVRFVVTWTKETSDLVLYLVSQCFFMVRTARNQFAVWIKESRASPEI